MVCTASIVINLGLVNTYVFTVGFSLLGHLDLDLELDDELPFAIPETIPAAEESRPSAPYTPSFIVPSVPSQNTGYSAPQLNSRQALFFPLPPSSGLSTKARPKDLFDVARENKWSWRDPNIGFYRTGTDEDIKKKWEEEKVELTREWKRRCREAGKVSRRRTGGDRGDGDIGVGE